MSTSNQVERVPLAVAVERLVGQIITDKDKYVDAQEWGRLLESQSMSAASRDSRNSELTKGDSHTYSGAATRTILNRASALASDLQRIIEDRERSHEGELESSPTSSDAVKVMGQIEQVMGMVSKPVMVFSEASGANKDPMSNPDIIKLKDIVSENNFEKIKELMRIADPEIQPDGKNVSSKIKKLTDYCRNLDMKSNRVSAEGNIQRAFDAINELKDNKDAGEIEAIGEQINKNILKAAESLKATRDAYYEGKNNAAGLRKNIKPFMESIKGVNDALEKIQNVANNADNVKYWLAVLGIYRKVKDSAKEFMYGDLINYAASKIDENTIPENKRKLLGLAEYCGGNVLADMINREDRLVIKDEELSKLDVLIKGLDDDAVNDDGITEKQAFIGKLENASFRFAAKKAHEKIIEEGGSRKLSSGKYVKTIQDSLSEWSKKVGEGLENSGVMGDLRGMIVSKAEEFSSIDAGSLGHQSKEKSRESEFKKLLKATVGDERYLAYKMLYSIDGIDGIDGEDNERTRRNPLDRLMDNAKEEVDAARSIVKDLYENGGAANIFQNKDPKQQLVATINGVMQTIETSEAAKSLSRETADLLYDTLKQQTALNNIAREAGIESERDLDLTISSENDAKRLRVSHQQAGYIASKIDKETDWNQVSLAFGSMQTELKAMMTLKLGYDPLQRAAAVEMHDRLNRVERSLTREDYWSSLEYLKSTFADGSASDAIMTPYYSRLMVKGVKDNLSLFSQSIQDGDTHSARDLSSLMYRVCDYPFTDSELEKIEGSDIALRESRDLLIKGETLAKILEDSVPSVDNDQVNISKKNLVSEVQSKLLDAGINIADYGGMDCFIEKIKKARATVANAVEFVNADLSEIDSKLGHGLGSLAEDELRDNRSLALMKETLGVDLLDNRKQVSASIAELVNTDMLYTKLKSSNAGIGGKDLVDDVDVFICRSILKNHENEGDGFSSHPLRAEMTDLAKQAMKDALEDRFAAFKKSHEPPPVTAVENSETTPLTQMERFHVFLEKRELIKIQYNIAFEQHEHDNSDFNLEKLNSARNNLIMFDDMARQEIKSNIFMPNSGEVERGSIPDGTVSKKDFIEETVASLEMYKDMTQGLSNRLSETMSDHDGLVDHDAVKRLHSESADILDVLEGHLKILQMITPDSFEVNGGEFTDSEKKTVDSSIKEMVEMYREAAISKYSLEAIATQNSFYQNLDVKSLDSESEDAKAMSVGAKVYNRIHSFSTEGASHADALSSARDKAITGPEGNTISSLLQSQLRKVEESFNFESLIGNKLASVGNEIKKGNPDDIDEKELAGKMQGIGDALKDWSSNIPPGASDHKPDLAGLSKELESRSDAAFSSLDASKALDSLADTCLDAAKYLAGFCLAALGNMLSFQEQGAQATNSLVQGAFAPQGDPGVNRGSGHQSSRGAGRRGRRPRRMTR